MSHNIFIQNQSFILHPSGAVFWQEKSILLIADVHLGKVAHFRKHGAAIPPHVAFQNLEKLTEVSNHFQPKTICFLGDLFHSKINASWVDFTAWVDYTKANIVLVSGNHDIIPPYLFEDLGVRIVETWTLNNFLFTHHPTETKDLFNFCGHIHPGVKLQGTGRQSLRLPCFFKTKQQLILPAFGKFTGKFTLSPTTETEVFVIADDEIIQVSG